ncbi:MAG: hypothetical protein A3F68_08865 [Acidobacteria bacterium RIFCSPLOWO2_12_FULL_54_10]|nr:MAG: hypothetical protein A3F68_08865 [Acidobacteria bacterium RIFCSPLOWO2_12_FULL_54_10]
MVVALAIAFSKIALVALFVMHVRYSLHCVHWALNAGIFWLGSMMLRTMSNGLTHEKWRIE